jgi:hypothetical protein
MSVQRPTFLTIAQTAQREITGQLLVDRHRCEDIFLDLYAATNDGGLRSSITARLREIHRRSMIEADEMRADLAAMVAVAIAWGLVAPDTGVSSLAA